MEPDDRNRTPIEKSSKNRTAAAIAAVSIP